MQGQPPSGNEKTTINLSLPRVFAGALASVSAALVASTFGLAGTLIGAALTSIVVTVGSAIYLHSIEQARTRVRFVRDGRTGRMVQQVVRPRVPHSFSWRALPWRALAGSMVLIFALALAAITAFEVGAHKPLSAVVRGEPSSGQQRTTITALVHDAAQESTTAPAPTPTPEAAPTKTPAKAPAAEPTVEPTAEPTSPATVAPKPKATTTAQPTRPSATPSK